MQILISMLGAGSLCLYLLVDNHPLLNRPLTRHTQIHELELKNMQIF
jgi:hypothetical protein